MSLPAIQLQIPARPRARESRNQTARQVEAVGNLHLTTQNERLDEDEEKTNVVRRV